MNQGKSPTKSPDAIGTTSQGFTQEERAAMKERANELKAEARTNKNKWWLCQPVILVIC